MLHEPLVHFLLFGALLFAFVARRDDPPARDDHIVVTSARIAHLSDAFAATFQRPPTRAELERLVDDWVRDEVYVREARRLGIDRDDEVVRRRLRQQMEFFVDDASAPAAPTDAELDAYLAAHADRFRREPTFGFEHVFFRSERADDARVVLARLDRDGGDAKSLGDPVLLPAVLEHASRSDVARLFGEPFAQQLADVPVGRWSGPLASAYGLHLVLVRERDDARVPPLSAVREAVERDWRADRRRADVDAAWRRMRAGYDVRVDWPR